MYHIIGIAICLLCSAFFSGSETALFSLSNLKVQSLAEKRGARGAVIAALLANPRRLLISILIGNMFVNILSSTIADSFIRSLIPGGKGTLLAIVVMSFAILVVGEITPKTIAIQFPERISCLVAGIINAIGNLLAPLRRVIRFISDAIISLFSRRLAPSEHAITEEELKTAIKVGYREGVVDSQEREMIHGVFDFADKTVGELMRPRQEIVAFDISHPLDEIVKTITLEEYSRIPIFDGTFENIVGILYAKDLLRVLPEKSELNLREVVRPAYIVPESKSATSLFSEFRKRKTHMAIVVDEYGGIAGLITLEDLLEEIVGEIHDKGDVSPLYQRIGPHRFRVSARMELDEFNKLLNSTITDSNNVTIGGVLSSLFENIPPVGASIRHDGILFTITAAGKSRIEEFIATVEEKE